MTTERIWFCKVGGPADFFEDGADLPMRRAIAKAFREVTGRDPQFTFSGWAGELTEGERAVVENREPKRCELDHPHHYACTHCGIGPTIAGQPGLETFSEPSAADMANAGARKELEGFSDAFAARDELKRSEAEARAKRQG